MREKRDKMRKIRGKNDKKIREERLLHKNISRENLVFTINKLK